MSVTAEEAGLRLRTLRARPVNLPMRRPIQTATGEMRTSPLVLIDVTTDEGITGSSYVFCYAPPALAAVAAALSELAPSLRGVDLAPVPLWEGLRRRFRLLGATGVLGLALAGIDMAAWDALARAARLPLAALLGGHADAELPAYGSLKSMDPDAVAQEASERRAEGHRAFKVKLGGGDLATDLEVLGALRAAVGAEAPVMVDYNQSLDRVEARRRLRRLDAERLAWIEEPLPAEDIEGLARLAREIETPIQAGESWWGPHEAARSVAAGGSDLVMLDVARIGGVTGWLRASAIAAARGLPISSHAYPEVSAHLLAVTPGAHMLEHLDHTTPVLAEAIRVRDGRVAVPPGPGSGVRWDEDAVARVEALR